MAQRAPQVEGLVELGGRERDLGIRLEDGAERPALGPGRARVALDDAVRLVAGEAGGDESEKDGLGEHETERALGQVLQRTLGVDDEALGQPGRLAQDVTGQHRCVGQRDPLHRAVRDVALVPQGHVLEPGAEVAAQEAGQSAQALGEDRVALVGHRRAALLAGTEGFLRLAYLAAGEVADLGAHQLDGRADGGAGVEILGVAVPGDDLGGRYRREAEGGAHPRLDGRIDVRVGADGTRELADGDRLAGRPHAPAVAVRLQRPQRVFRAEGGRLGVHAVRAPGDRHAQQLEGPRLEHGHERIEVGEQEVRRLGEGGAQRGVHHVRGRQPVVDVRAGRGADALLDDVDERGHVVVGDLLALEHVGHEDVVDHGRLGPAGRGLVRRHVAERRLGLGGQELDLEPHGEPGLVAEERRHVGRRVARDHRTGSRAATPAPAAWAAMSWRSCMPSHSIGAAAA